MRIEVQRQQIYAGALAVILLLAALFAPIAEAAVSMARVDISQKSDATSPFYVELEWETATEQDAAVFFIQRVNEGDSFPDASGDWNSYNYGSDVISVEYNNQPTQEVSAQGSVGSGATYTVIDRTVEADMSYQYRIVEVDQNGTMSPQESYVRAISVTDPDSTSGSAIGASPTEEAATEMPTVEATATEEATVTIEATSSSEDATETPEPTETPTVEPETTEEASETTSDATETPEPTGTPEPTATQEATETPEPTATNTPEPTVTQTPVADNPTTEATATLVVVATSTPRNEEVASEESAEQPTPPAEAVVEERSADPEEAEEIIETAGSVASVAVSNENEEKAEAQAIAGVAVAEAAESDEAYPVESARTEEVSVEANSAVVETSAVEVDVASAESYPVSAETSTTADNSAAAASDVTADNSNLIVFPTIEPSAVDSNNSINAGSNASQIGGNSSSGDVIGGDGSQLAPPVQTGDTSSNNSDSGSSSILLWVVFGAGILVFIAGVIGSILIFTRNRED